MNEKQDKNARERELDDFWDISALIPPKKNPPSRAPVSVTLTEIIDGDGGEEKRFDGGDLSQTRLTQAPSPKSLPQREGNAVPTVKKKTDETGSTVITRFIPPHTPEPIKKPPAPDDEYTPQESMLHRVRIFRWQTSFQYYEDFCLQATALRDRHGSPCQPVAFLSYVPPY